MAEVNVSRARADALTVGATVVAAVLLTVTGRSLESRLLGIEHATGYLLLFLTAALAAFGARKKVPYLPLGTAAQWLRVHVSLGVLAVVVLALHAGVSLPNGLLETLLFVAFAVVSMSGVIGLFISRSFAQRLTTRGQEVIWERIPALRARIREEAEAVVRRSQSEHHSTAVADVYESHVAAFLARPRNFVAHVAGSSRPVKGLLRELDDHDRYASSEERELTRELRELVIMKDDLDFHWALQGVLKGWLFVHVPATCLLLVLALAHGALAEAFAAGFVGSGVGAP